MKERESDVHYNASKEQRETSRIVHTQQQSRNLVSLPVGMMFTTEQKFSSCRPSQNYWLRPKPGTDGPGLAAQSRP